MTDALVRFMVIGSSSLKALRTGEKAPGRGTAMRWRGALRACFAPSWLNATNDRLVRKPGQKQIAHADYLSSTSAPAVSSFDFISSTFALGAPSLRPRQVIDPTSLIQFILETPEALWPRFVVRRRQTLAHCNQWRCGDFA